jgi:uncharacterized protein YukE
MQLHCGLAEVGLRVGHLEQSLTKLKHDDMAVQLFFRLGELDEALEAVQQGALGRADMRHQQLTTMHHDRELVARKVAALKAHSKKVKETLQARVKELQRGPQGSAAQGSPEEQQAAYRAVRDELWGLEQRVDALDSIMGYIDGKEAQGEDLSYEEYEIILQAIKDSGVHQEELHKDVEQLPAVKEVMQRRSSAAYHEAGLQQHLHELQHLKKQREESRREFEDRFVKVLQNHKSSAPEHFFTTLQTHLSSLPQYCVDEASGVRLVRLLCWGLVAALAASAHTALTAVLHLNKREE